MTETEKIRERLKIIEKNAYQIDYISKSFARVGNFIISEQLSEIKDELLATIPVIENSIRNILDERNSHDTIMQGNVLDILLNPDKFNKLTNSKEIK